MKTWLRHSGRAPVWLLIVAFLAAGCSSAGLSAASPSPAISSPTGTLLTVARTPVTTVHTGEAPVARQTGDSIPIEPKDQVQIEGKGRAFLEFPHQLEVELVRSGEVDISELQLPANGPARVVLKQVRGHTFSRVESNEAVKLEVDTDYAAVTPLTDDAQFLVCQVPGVLTCVVAVNGKTRVEAQNQAVTLNTGEVTYVTPGQAPHAPFCADLTEVRDWWSQMRGTDDAGDLGSMIVGWLQKPCALAGGHTATPPASPAAPLPSPTSAATEAKTSAPASNTATALPAAATAMATEATAAPVQTATTGPAAGYASSAPPTATGAPPSSDGMVQVAAGQYVIGNSPPDGYHAATQTVDLKSFWIDTFLVTNAQFKAFLDQTGRAAPASWSGGSFPPGKDMQPASGLTWGDAAAYCTWVHKRLPSEVEWEAAGRGPGAQPPLFPWGNDPTAGGKTYNLPQLDPYDVGSVAFNRSPFGVFDMVGNVWQWVDQPYAPVAAGFRILRGGRHGLLEDLAYRQPAMPDDDRFTRVAGVRCAADRVAGE